MEGEEVALKVDPADASLKGALFARHYLLAMNLMKKEFYLPMVEPHLKRCIAIDPKNVESLIMLGSAYYSAMRYTSAVKSYEKALALAPDNLSVYKMAGDACVASGDFDKARKFYSGLIEKAGRQPSGYDRHDIDEAKTVMKALPETYKDIDRLLKDSRLVEAEELLKKRLSLNQSDYVALTQLGSIYQERGNRALAMKFFRNAAKIAPDYPIAHFFLGRALFLTQKADEAIKEFDLFKEKMALLPKMDQETRKMYTNDLHYIAEAYFTLKMYREFRGEIEDILKLDPKDQDAWYALGVYYYVGEHNRPRTYEALKKARDMDPSTDTGKKAKYAIEYIRTNPDSRIIPDFSFLNKEYRE